MDENKCLFCDSPVIHQMKARSIMDQRDCPQCGKYEFFYSDNTFDKFRDWGHRRHDTIVPKIKSANQFGIRYMISLQQVEQDTP